MLFRVRSGPLRATVPHMYVVRGLRQALIMIVGAVLLALVVAGIWTVWQGGDFRRTLSLTLLVLAGLLAVTGSNVLARGETNDINAFLGRGPDREDPSYR